MLKPLLTFGLIFLFLPGLCQQDTTKHIADNNCDVITLKNGQLIYCKIQSTSKHSLVYYPCSDTSKKQLSVSRDSIFMVNKQDGTIVKGYRYSSSPLDNDTYVSVSIGYGIPVLEFSSPGPVNQSEPQTLDEAHGLRDNALTGMVYDLSFQYHPTDAPAGLVTFLGYAVNRFDIDAYSKVTFLASPNLAGSGVVPPGGTYTVSNEYTGNYQAYKLLFGPSVGSHDKYISIRFYFAGGLSLCKFPSVGYTFYASGIASPLGNTQSVAVGQSSTIGFSLQTGTSMRIFVFKGFNIIAGINYYYCDANFPNTIVTTGITGITTSQHVNMDIRYDLLNLTLGLAYSLGK